MDRLLEDVEVRILGCLIEKELTTPDNYPMTLNALKNACNQKSNRNPVISYDESTIVASLDTLRRKGLALKSLWEGNRVPKYRHFMEEKYSLTPQQLAVLAELLVRGAQTIGELRSRGERMTTFSGTDEVSAVIEGFMEREGGDPWVMQLPRRVGQKESRYAHLLAGVPDFEDEPEPAARPEGTTRRARVDDERIEKLEAEVETLRGELASLRDAFGTFKSQFE